MGNRKKVWYRAVPIAMFASKAREVYANLLPTPTPRLQNVSRVTTGSLEADG